MEVRVTNVNILRGPKSRTRELDLGLANIEAVFIYALQVSVPMHNQDHDECATTLAYYLKQNNLRHLMTTNKCFMTASYVHCHKLPPPEKSKLINPCKLGKYELGIECTLTTSGGGYDDGTFEPTDGCYVTRSVTGPFTRYMEFIFDTSVRQDPATKEYVRLRK
jgi:hypothetical protein